MTARRLVTLWLLALAAAFALTACDGAMGDQQAPSVTDPDLLYGDDFSPEGVGPWLVERDEHGATAVEDGRMFVDVIQPGTVQYTTLDGHDFSDFDLVVETQLIEGDREATYGVFFRMTGPEQFYRFEITGDGRYAIERREPDNWQRLTSGWLNSEAIMSGTGAVNELRVTAEGPSLAFYANDQLLHELQDSVYSGGQIALDAGTFGGQRTIVAFDNLAIRAQE
jgi:hypothetical protein